MNSIPDIYENTSFGWFNWRPYSIQNLLLKRYGLWPFIIVLCVAAFIEGFAVNGLVNVVVSSIEKQFRLSSSLSGAVVSAYDIAFLLLATPVSFWGGQNQKMWNSLKYQGLNCFQKFLCIVRYVFIGNKIRFLSFGMMVMGLGSLLFCVPKFITSPYYQRFLTTQTLLSFDSNVISKNLISNSFCRKPVVYNNTAAYNYTLSNYLSDSESVNSPSDDQTSTILIFFLFFLGNFLHGVGSCPLFTLGITYIDENAHVEKVALYLGVYYAMSILGPAVGFLSGALILNINVDVFNNLLSPPEDFINKTTSYDTPKYFGPKDSSDDRWVGAWWLGFVVSCIAAWLICIPISGFPSTYPGMKSLYESRLKQGFQGLKSKSRNKNGPEFNSTNNNETSIFSTDDTIHPIDKKDNAMDEWQTSLTHQIPITADDFSCFNLNNPTTSHKPSLANNGSQNEYCLTSEQTQPLNLGPNENLPNIKGSTPNPSTPIFTRIQHRFKSIFEPITARNLVLNGTTQPKNNLNYVPSLDIGHRFSFSRRSYTGNENNGDKRLQNTNLEKFSKFVRITKLDEKNDKLREMAQLTPNKKHLHFREGLKSLLTNPVFMFITLGGAFDGLVLNGFAAFLPKYLELQFDVTAKNASMYVGIIVVPAGMLGMLLGGYLIKRSNVSVLGMLKMVFFISLTNFCAFFILLLYCPETNFAGVNSPYPNLPGQNSLNDESLVNSHQLANVLKPSAIINTCNAKCQCDYKYEPVCWESKGITFFSKCFAGCTSQDNSSNLTKNIQLYDCGCVSNYSNSQNFTDITNFIDDKTNNVNQRIVFGKCSPRCSLGTLNITHLMIIFMFAMFLALFALLMVAVISVNATLRCVESNETSFAMGIQWVLVRLLGTIPGPIIFGFIMDKSCLLWDIKSYNNSPNDSTAFPNVNHGACNIYNNRKMAFDLLTVGILTKLIAQLFYGLAYYSYAKYENHLEISTSTIKTKPNIPTPIN